ncbi:hypothetical protein PYW07_015546 [Mythimna separata]|uniref:Uncharacterized protein n=1 Tax=Mythimna separata TaxID=271217 RepID=A0AAD8DZY6_MYTSE|nr:hypothetical protein PYW07_015546 [Mythimna separata]
MCRSVILAVVAASFVCCVLAEADPPTNITTTKAPSPSSTDAPPAPKPNVTKCANTPEMIERRKLLLNCFNTTVQVHLGLNDTMMDKNCTNTTVFAQKLEIYFTDLYKTCNATLNFNTTYFMKLVEYSLNNNSFKTFYENITCFKSVETNVSNECVKGKLGFFNITKTEKHTKWYQKGELMYDVNTCGNSKLVRDCVALKLQQCPHTTTDYVGKLFEYTRSLGNCSQYKDTDNIPSSKGNGTAAASTWLTKPVIITLSIGAVVVGGAIITVAIIKNK